MGLNSRLDEMQAAILRVKLSKLDAWNMCRRKIAQSYHEQLWDCPHVETPVEIQDIEPLKKDRNELSDKSHLLSVYHQYTLKSKHRDRLVKSLKRQDIESAVYYPFPLHLQLVHGDLGYQPGSFPCAERLSRECLSLPIYPELTYENQQCVVNALKAALISELGVSAA
jgi:dTDP-4-amino-4,6-dideoxygalactose transaminase